MRDRRHMPIRTNPATDRRRFLRLGAALTGAFTACKPTQTVEQAEPSSLGKPLSAYGERSPFEKVARLPAAVKNPEIGSSPAPPQDSFRPPTPPSPHLQRPPSRGPRPAPPRP